MPILCHFILSSQGQNLLKGSRVLELGAGIGVPGILAGRVCAELVLTDSNDGESSFVAGPAVDVSPLLLSLVC